MEYIYPTIMMLLALFASIAIVATLGSFLHLSHKLGNGIIRISILLISASIAISVIVGGRDLSHVGESINNLYSENSGGGTFIIKISTWLIVLLLTGVLFDRIIQKKIKPDGNAIRYGWLTIFFIYVFSNGITSSIFGTHPSLTIGLIYPLIPLAILVVDKNWSAIELLNAIKNGTLIVISIGLILLAIKPSMVIEGSAGGSFALLPFRYWGASPHANAIGSIAVLFLLLEILIPTQNKKWRALSILITLITIILAQSKTAIIGLVFSMACIWIVPKESDSANIQQNQIEYTLKLIFVTLLPILIYIAFFAAGYDSKLDQLLASDAGKSVTTLTGRTKIWEAALREWQDNPIFGYGPDLFSAEHRIRLGMLFAFHAHNQFIQTLAQSGLVGLFGLLLLIGALAYNLLKKSIPSKGISLALLSFLLIRCITEVPLRSGNLLSGEYLYLLAMAIIAMAPREELLVPSKQNKQVRIYQ